MEKVTQLFYDAEGDVLYLSIGEPRPAVSQELGEDVLLRVDGLGNDPLYRAALDDRAVLEQVEIETKYAGYIERQKNEIAKFERAEHMLIPDDFDYARVHSLSTEGRSKLMQVRPRSVGQAARISGVSSSDVSILMVYLKV